MPPVAPPDGCACGTVYYIISNLYVGLFLGMCDCVWGLRVGWRVAFPATEVVCITGSQSLGLE